MISIGSNRECFFDAYLIDERKTTAKFLMHHPRKQEMALYHDQPWEGDYCGYNNFFFDETYHGYDGTHPEGVYRMYYTANRSAYPYSTFSPEDVAGGAVFCYAESPDGIHWVKPKLHLFSWNGSTENNIIMDKTLHPDIDNLYVFRDDNPDCPPEERYKGISAYDEPKKPNGEKGEFRLFSFLSPDGIHFRMGNMLTNKGFFDSLNIIMWDGDAGCYRGYVRGVHIAGQDPSQGHAELSWDKVSGQIRSEARAAGGVMPDIVRDILYIESKDFKTWSDPVWLKYDDGKELQLYTNGISRYFRAPQMYIGMPTRYYDRKAWSGSYEQLCGLEKRRIRYETDNPRAATALTDCAFMTSRDGIHFHRYPNAFIKPQPENGRNWVYGDCFPTPNFAVTASPSPGAPEELSLYMHENHMGGIPGRLYRYTLRMDGFVSLHSEEKEERIVTKPFRYEGENLYANFETSAMGYVYFTLISETGERFESCETFGDAIDRKIVFDGSTVSALSGKPVTLEIRMFDGDLYAIRFGK